ncbi:MAG TPA: hypothetical protein VFF16_06235 [Telluria sp.]|nr:hypothetical protein [Telluria sp.]
MANKALATRQKMRIRIEPSQSYGKPRNPVAQAAKQRAAGSHVKSASAERQAQKRALAKALKKEKEGV